MGRLLQNQAASHNRWHTSLNLLKEGPPGKASLCSPSPLLTSLSLIPGSTYLLDSVQLMFSFQSCESYSWHYLFSFWKHIRKHIFITDSNLSRISLKIKLHKINYNLQGVIDQICIPQGVHWCFEISACDQSRAGN